MQKCIKKLLIVNTKKYYYIENDGNTRMYYEKEISKWKRKLEVFMK